MRLKLFILVIILGLVGISCNLPDESTSSDTNSGIILITNITTTEVIESIFVKGNYLYAAAGYDGLIIYEIINPSNLQPVTGGSYTTTAPIHDVVVKDIGGQNYAFCAIGTAGGLGGVMALNVTDVTNITIDSNNHVVTNIPGAKGNAVYVKSDNTKAFVADQNKGVYTYIVDLANNGLSNVNGATDLGSPPVDIVESGGYLYTAVKNAGLYILDDNDPPALQSVISSPLSYVNSVAVSGNTLIVGDQMLGVYVYDITSPTKPSYQAFYNTSGEAYDVKINGNDIFVADGSGGILWLYLSSPKTVIQKGHLLTTGIAYKIYYTSNPFIYAAYGPDGIKVFQLVGN